MHPLHRVKTLQSGSNVMVLITLARYSLSPFISNIWMVQDFLPSLYASICAGVCGWSGFNNILSPCPNKLTLLRGQTQWEAVLRKVWLILYETKRYSLEQSEKVNVDLTDHVLNSNLPSNKAMCFLLRCHYPSLFDPDEAVGAVRGAECAFLNQRPCAIQQGMDRSLSSSILKCFFLHKYIVVLNRIITTHIL